jgi:divalent metal cation (Fe/Co/Zn/Cd) transporter
MIEFISIVALTFALALVVLGAITLWLERGRARLQGVVLVALGLVIGAAYGFLGSRFSVALFERLIVQVDLPALMATALTYTAGVLSGASLAVGIFLWATNRFRRQVERAVVVFVIAGSTVAVVSILLAVILGRP